MHTALLLMISAALGASATFHLHKQNMSIVVASCCVGLLGAAVEHLTKVPQLSLVVYAGSFVGMTSAVVGNVYSVALAGLFVGYLFYVSGNYFQGYGGRLGALAFISCCVVYFLFELKSYLK